MVAGDTEMKKFSWQMEFWKVETRRPQGDEAVSSISHVTWAEGIDARGRSGSGARLEFYAAPTVESLPLQMPNLNLKFKGNKSFVAFSNIGDSDALTMTWKVCTKVASYLEQGQRLENLSWRLWHIQSLIVDTDNAKSKRNFKKLSKCMSDKLDKEKGRSIEELEVPDYRHSHSAEIIRLRAAEKERSREASQSAKPGTIKRMQFTFSVDHPSPATSQLVKKPDLRPSAEFTKRTRSAAARTATPTAAEPNGNSDKDSSTHTLRFPSLFSSDFGPSALLYPALTVTNSMNYGEGLNSSASNDGFGIVRPTIEVPLDEILKSVDDCFSFASVSTFVTTPTSRVPPPASRPAPPQEDVVMQSATFAPPPAPVSIPAPEPRKTRRRASAAARLVSENNADDITTRHRNSVSVDLDKDSNGPLSPVSLLSQAVKEMLPETVAPSKVNSLAGSQNNASSGRPTLTVRTQNTNSSASSRSSVPGATATNNSRASNNNNSAPGGVKAECSNCGATHTPLWRRGLNDELNCNACGLYCKLHKRPRPKSMRNSHGEGRTQSTPRQETVDVMGKLQHGTHMGSGSSALPAQCYNCHTTATPLWRKDDEGKTVCNACGLYYKLHGSARPISMKSDVIRKRSRHDARRGNNASETPSVSPCISRRPSPAREPSPTLAPDSTTQVSYDYHEDMDYRSAQSELLGALGGDSHQTNLFSSSYQFHFPGPYHPDYLLQHYSLPSEPLPFSTNMETSTSSDNSEMDLNMSPRSPKRRRMSTDSASEPPSSAASYSSFDNYSAASSVTSNSARSSVDYPFSFSTPGCGAGNGKGNSNGNSNGSNGSNGNGNSNSNKGSPNSTSPNGTGSSGNSNNNSSSSSNGQALRGTGSGNTFWHPPMLPHGGDRSPVMFHPPMLPPTDDSPMDYLHPPMVLPDDAEALFSTYLHPPMVLPDEGGVSCSGTGGAGGAAGTGGSGGASPMRVF
ncbi:hypothetical protein APHAL10511_005452 [Amanita phalloides]|nr:hypothetical protein APHAL10511_005452 [Amanita phalloides]